MSLEILRRATREIAQCSMLQENVWIGAFYMLKGEKSGARAFTPLLWGKCVIVKIGCLCDKCIQNCSTMPQCFKVKMLICTPPKDPFAALKFRRSTPVAIS